MFPTLLALIIDYEYTISFQGVGGNSDRRAKAEIKVNSQGSPHDVSFVYNGIEYFCFNRLSKEVKYSGPRTLIPPSQGYYIRSACFTKNPDFDGMSTALNDNVHTDAIGWYSYSGYPNNRNGYFNIDFTISNIFVRDVNPDLSPFMSQGCESAFVVFMKRNEWKPSTYNQNIFWEMSLEMPPEYEYSLYYHRLPNSSLKETKNYLKELFGIGLLWEGYLDDYSIKLFDFRDNNFIYGSYSHEDFFNADFEYGRYADTDDYTNNALNNVLIAPECEGWHPDNQQTNPESPNSPGIYKEEE